MQGMSKRPKRFEREMLEIAEKLGFEFVRTTGRGHMLLRHSNGASTTISSTPHGESIAKKSATQQLRRIANGDVR